MSDRDQYEERDQDDRDERTDNVRNNVMRHEYTTLSEDQLRQTEHIKDMGLLFWEACDQIGNSRELSLAKTKIEEAVMWATKAVTG